MTVPDSRPVPHSPPTGAAWQGLRFAAQDSSAFRTELLLAALGTPLAFWLGRSWLEVVLLCAALWLLLVVELVNCGIEAVIDRIGYDFHPLSKMAKDFGSAAVFTTSLYGAVVWGSLAWLRWQG